ncbi:fatty acyl-AMP ligase [Pleurocapsa sp. PCC 7319]|uniref:fatty acyl-AMP ligase n=1 Tax=Pleurocapsa sp. PCC 7319 TaxID=118161 RepID=UPI00034DEC2B|nr:fatty acyl-AMP ligase [Pleurocapsa sp. PCC 7319]
MTDCLGNTLKTKHKFSTLVELLSYRAQNQPDYTTYTFLQHGEEVNRLTYFALDRQARAIAASLQSMEATSKRALLLYPPGLEFIAAFFGCLYAGVVAVPAYPPRRNQNLSRLLSIMEDSQANFALTTKSLMDKMEERLSLSPELAAISWLTTDDLDSDYASIWQQPKVDIDTLAFLQYTSGSTGKPKGVMLSHGNLLYNEEMVKVAYQHTEKTIFVGWLPLFHDMGLIGNVLQPMYLGIPSFLMSPVDFLQRPFRWLQAISRYRATTSGGPNFAYDLCVRKITPEQIESLDLSSWEIAFNGAETVHAHTLEQFSATFEPCGFRREAFYPCYGMAETALFISGGVKTALPVIQKVEKSALEKNRVVTATNENDEQVQTIVGCGQTWLNQKISIVNPETLTLCPTGNIGEIWVSGSNVAKGYWNRPAETEQTFNAYIANTGEGPFLRTGDLGFLQDGELFVTGRIKDVIIVRGQNHYPQDIELTVQNSHPALRPSCGAAFTVDVNSAARLVIVQEIERSYLRKLKVNAVVESIRQAVTAEHGLQVYAIVLVKTGSIPKTSSGKIQRHACRAGFLSGSLNVVEDWSINPQGKVKFLHLQTEVESVLQKLQKL